MTTILTTDDQIHGRPFLVGFPRNDVDPSGEDLSEDLAMLVGRAVMAAYD